MIFLIYALSTFAIAAPSTPSSIAEYASLLDKARKTNGSVEVLYKKGNQALNDLASSLSYDEGEIDAKWLAATRKHLEGFKINPNTETILGYPSLDFFLSLAKKNKQAPAVAFFQLNLRTEANGWPTYKEQQTDLGGCTKYDGTLSKLYNEWAAFIKNNPKTFSELAKQNFGSIKAELTEGTCACAKAPKSIIQEFEIFVKNSPKDKISPILKTRIQNLKNGKSDIRLDCVGGG